MNYYFSDISILDNKEAVLEIGITDKGKADIEQMERKLWKIVKILPTDYKDYGGNIRRWADADMAYPDCSMGCIYFRQLLSEWEDCEDADWGVCVSELSPRAGLLTFEHQAGVGCFTHKNSVNIVK